MGYTVQKTNNNQNPIGWMLLRDGHAIPLIGLSPEEIKESRTQAVEHPEAALRHKKGLDAIIHTLGFRGDFGTYKEEGWPGFQRFLADNGCKERRTLFSENQLDSSPFSFGPLGGPKRRQLADRVFVSKLPVPNRVFLGCGVDWDFWDQRASGVLPLSFSSNKFRRDEEFVATDREHAIRFLIDHRFELFAQWGFLDDKLVDGPLHNVVDKTYYARGEPQTMRDLRTRQILALIRAFRNVFEVESAGWVDLLWVNPHLVILRAHDGAWDVIWRDLRETPPPQLDDRVDRYQIHSDDLPMSLVGENDIARRLYFRRGAWEEAEAHAAEQHFYDMGRTQQDRQMTKNLEVIRLYLMNTGKLPCVDRAIWEGEPPVGFKRIDVNGCPLLVSELITVGDFQRMIVETGYLDRRNLQDDDWSRANVGASDSEPVGATWKDAQVFCAWKERQIGVAVRLPTRNEHRAMRPFFSDWYTRLAAMGFLWEHRPPKPIISNAPDGSEVRTQVPSAIAWSEARFHEPAPDMPEFLDASGFSYSSGRKRFPPIAKWTDNAWAEHSGLRFIDAWDAYEWCQEVSFMAGRFSEDEIGAGSWGAYKKVKVGFRLVIALS